MAATRFAPGVVSTEAHEVLFGFFEDGARLFLERTPQDFEDDWIHAPVYRAQLREGAWTELEPIGETGSPWYVHYPEAREGTRVAFPWRSRLDGGGPARDIDIWIAVKGTSGWNEPERLPPPVNLESFDSSPSLSGSGALYFFSDREGGIGGLDLYHSAPTDSGYGEVENLGPGINSEHRDHDPFIAPDESYLVWCSDRPGGFGDDDLYVSHRRPDGTWTSPRNLGEGVNTPADESRPSVTADGKYLFFNSTAAGSRDVYWVDAGVLRADRP